MHVLLWLVSVYGTFTFLRSFNNCVARRLTTTFVPLVLVKRLIDAPLALMHIVKSTCAPVTPTGLLYGSFLVLFGHLVEHEQAVCELCGKPNFALIVNVVMPPTARWVFQLPWRCLNTERAHLAQLVSFDGTYTILCSCLLRTAVQDRDSSVVVLCVQLFPRPLFSLYPSNQLPRFLG